MGLVGYKYSYTAAVSSFSSALSSTFTTNLHNVELGTSFRLRGMSLVFEIHTQGDD